LCTEINTIKNKTHAETWWIKIGRPVAYVVCPLSRSNGRWSFGNINIGNSSVRYWREWNTREPRLNNLSRWWLLWSDMLWIWWLRLNGSIWLGKWWCWIIQWCCQQRI
jgi:hypothetical protein